MTLGPGGAAAAQDLLARAKDAAKQLAAYALIRATTPEAIRQKGERQRDRERIGLLVNEFEKARPGTEKYGLIADQLSALLAEVSTRGHLTGYSPDLVRALNELSIDLSPGNVEVSLQ